MKKAIVFTGILLVSFAFGVNATSAAVNSTTINKLNESREELEKQHTQGKSYILRIDSFFSKTDIDAKQLSALITRINKINASLLSSQSDIRLVLDYMKYKATFALLNSQNAQNNIQLSDEQVVLAINNVHKKIEEKYAGKKLDASKVIGVTLDIKNRYYETWTIGHPNYESLGISKSKHVDVYGNEYFIVVLKDRSDYYYQVMGYIEKSSTEKMAVVMGNYVQETSRHPESLFVDPVTGRFITNGAIFSRK